MRPPELKVNIKGRKLKDIEKRILELKLEIANQARIQHGHMSQELIDLRVKEANKPLKAELEILEKQRDFIIDERNSLFWRIIWNFFVPIIVSILTTCLLLRIFHF